jgi:hypothetical protein
MVTRNFNKFYLVQTKSQYDVYCDIVQLVVLKINDIVSTIINNS